MIKKISFFSLLAVLIGFNSCETEFSLNGDYELTPVVFGLLDQNDTIHMIKITKAFLGDENNLVYAKNPDSNYFKQVDAKIIELKPSGVKTGREWALIDSIVENKSTDGVFYAPDQKVYYFSEANLDESMIYRIEADLNEGAEKFSAETNLMNGFDVPHSVESPTLKIRFAKNTVNESKDYVIWSFDLSPGFNAGKFEVSYTFNWTEHYLDGTTASFSKKKYEHEESDFPDNNFGTPVKINGLEFYKWVENTIPDDPNVDYRTSDGIDLHLSVAHKTLKQYLEVSKPVTGIAQIQPVFTNVTGGYGLFSSRYLYHLKGIPLSETTIKELAQGQYTISKSFCSSYALHNEESFFCP